MLSDISQRILELKKEKDVCILAHSYTTPDILEIADFTGDSFGLARQAAKSAHRNIMMVGVRFMAETCKILSPEKRVFLPEPDAGCPMAEQLDAGSLAKLREEHPGYTVVCYINTTADLKVLCDVCVTSSSAVKIISRIENDKILFIPDCNLGDFVSKAVPDKTFAFIKGGCPVHRRLSTMDVMAAKMAHPDAPLLVHPEASPKVCEAADYVGSTTGIMQFAAESDAKEFIIGTENAIVQHLSLEHPEKRFYPLSKETICPNMKLNTILSVLRCLEGTDGEEIFLPDEVMTGARKCIDEMLRLG
ncbi:MAG: quinolinate synthase NadA [Oscillospiraceae bacterium]|nr:quinolinate synthase NadA [Oscillospiraceae bacterium]